MKELRIIVDTQQRGEISKKKVKRLIKGKALNKIKAKSFSNTSSTSSLKGILLETYDADDSYEHWSSGISVEFKYESAHKNKSKNERVKISNKKRFGEIEVTLFIPEDSS